MRCAFAMFQWISTLENGFPAKAWTLSGNSWLDRYGPALGFLVPSVEHEGKTSALICQEIHLGTPDSTYRPPIDEQLSEVTSSVDLKQWFEQAASLHKPSPK